MSLKLKSITLNTTQMDNLVRFYKAVGIELLPFQVDKGGNFFKGFFNGVEFKVMGILKNEKLSSPDLALQFEVKSIDECEARLLALPDATFILQKAELPYGKVIVVLDPDGHSVEMIEVIPLI